MALIKSVGDFFGLDIGTNAVRVVQLSQNGQSWNLLKYGYAPIDASTSASDSPEARRKVADIVMTAVGQSGIKSRDVAIGLPSQKTFTTVIDVPAMSEVELRNSIKYQIDQYIPMSVEDSKVDWKLLGQSLHDPKQQEVLLTSTASSYSENRLEFVESLGFNVIAAEPEPIAMIRSLLPSGLSDARLLVNMGEQTTDLVITYGEVPRLVRTIPVGLNALLKAAVTNLNVQEEQARQFILKFGLAPDRLDGQVLRALETTLDNFTSELTKSIKFFQTRYPSTSIGGILLAGYAASTPRFGEYVAAKTGVQVEAANPWQKVRVDQNAQQQLLPIMHEFGAVVGLAQRSNR